MTRKDYSYKYQVYFYEMVYEKYVKYQCYSYVTVSDRSVTEILSYVENYSHRCKMPFYFWDVPYHMVNEIVLLLHYLQKTHAYFRLWNIMNINPLELLSIFEVPIYKHQKECHQNRLLCDFVLNTNFTAHTKYMVTF